MDTATEISNQVTITGSAFPGGISGTTFDVSVMMITVMETRKRSNITPLNVTNQIEATKTATTTDINGNGQIDAGDKINYEITIKNTGNTSLRNFTCKHLDTFKWSYCYPIFEHQLFTLKR